MERRKAHDKAVNPHRTTRKRAAPVSRSRKKDASDQAKALDRAHELLDRVFASPHHLIAYLDRDFNFLRVSSAYAQADGHEPDYYVGKNHFDLFPNSENQEIFRRVLEMGEPFFATAKPFEYAEHLERGTSYWDWSLYPLQDAQGKVSGLVLNLVDVTKRVCAEHDLERINRSLRTLSDCNEVLIRAQDETALLHDVCDVIVRVGGYRAASVGLARRERAGRIELGTFVSADAVQEAFARSAWMLGEIGPSLMGNAIRTGEPQLAQDLARAGVHASWRARAKEAGFAAAIAVPLASEGITVGALMIFAGERDAFDGPQIKLLTELAGDLAFGIQTLRTRLAREQAEEAVRQQAELLDLAHDAIVVRDLDSRIAYWSRGAEGTYGWKRDQVLGKKLHVLLETASPVSREDIERQVTALGHWEGDLVHSTIDGKRIVVASRWALQRDAAGHPRAFLEINRDITARRQAEEEIRRLHALDVSRAAELERRVRERTAQLEHANEELEVANEELRIEIENREEAEKQVRLHLTALESAANAIVITDLKGSIVWVNPAFSELTGYRREEVVGQNPRVLKSGEHRQEFYRGLWDCILSGRVWRGEMINRRKDGTLYMEEMSITPVRQAGGKITHFIAIKQDVSQRTMAERAVRESEERFRRIFEEGPLGMAIAGLEMRLTRVNARLCAMLGYVEGELTGRTIQEITHPEDIDKDVDLVRRLLDGKTPYFRLEKRYLKKSGEPVWAELTASIIRDHAGKPLHLLGMIEDISDRKRAEEAIQTLNQELTRRADDLASANHELEAFSYSVSHDLRTPLSAIQGFSGILLKEHAAQLDPSGQTYLRLVRDNAEYTTQLVQGLLAFSRYSRQPLKKTRVNMRELVQQAIEKQSAERHDRRVEITIGDLPDCLGDPVLLQQVWINLIGNALKYSRKREKTRIEIGSRMQDAPQGLGVDPETVYYVRDNGVGFDMENAEHLFGVFQRLHDASEYEGTGVGLAIVQRIIHRHGGRIWAEAEIEKGASFYFALAQS